MLFSQKILRLSLVCTLSGCGQDPLYSVLNRQDADPTQPQQRVVVVHQVVVHQSEIPPMQQWVGGDFSFPILPTMNVGSPPNLVLEEENPVEEQIIETEEPDTETTTIIVVVNTEEEAEDLLPDDSEATPPTESEPAYEETSTDFPETSPCLEPNLDFDDRYSSGELTINHGESIILSESIVARCGIMRLTGIRWGLIPARDDTAWTWDEGDFDLASAPSLSLNVLPGDDLQTVAPVHSVGTPGTRSEVIAWEWHSYEHPQYGGINMPEMLLPEDQWTQLSLALDTSFFAPGSFFRPILMLHYIQPDWVPVATLSYFARYRIRTDTIRPPTPPVSLTMASFAVACDGICSVSPMHFELRMDDEGHPSDYVQTCTLTRYATVVETVDGPRELDPSGRFLTAPMEVDPIEGRWFTFDCERKPDVAVAHDLIVRTYLLQDPEDASLDVLMGIATILAP